MYWEYWEEAEKLPGKVYRVAPGCGMIPLKVLDEKGNGNKEKVIQALKWIRGQHETVSYPY